MCIIIIKSNNISKQFQMNVNHTKVSREEEFMFVMETKFRISDIMAPVESYIRDTYTQKSLMISM